MRRAVRIHSLLVGGLFVVMLRATPADAASEFKKATPHGKAGCPAGAFPDPTIPGCWKCPKKYVRAVWPAVDKPGACERTMYASARPRERSTGFFACPKNQFVHWDGLCYSCPSGHDRTLLYAITSRQACSTVLYSGAEKVADGGCPNGAFIDIGRNECWACPPDWYRTVNPVDTEKACTNEVGGILAVDTNAACALFINAVREGEKKARPLMATLAETLGPVMKPMNEVMSTVESQVKTPDDLNKLVDSMAEQLRPYGPVIDKMERLSNQLAKARVPMMNLFLDPEVMCAGNLARLDERLGKLGLNPDLETGQSDDAAHAASKKPYWAFYLSLVVTPLGGAGPIVLNSSVLTVVTDFSGNGGVYLSTGRVGATNLTPGYSVGVQVFPHAEIDRKAGVDDFSFFGGLTVEVSLGAGARTQEILGRLWKKLGRGQALTFDSFSLSFDPVFFAKGEGKFEPGFGPSRNIPSSPTSGKGRQKVLDVGLSVDVTGLMVGWER